MSQRRVGDYVIYKDRKYEKEKRENDGRETIIDYDIVIMMTIREERETSYQLCGSSDSGLLLPFL